MTLVRRKRRREILPIASSRWELVATGHIHYVIVTVYSVRLHAKSDPLSHAGPFRTKPRSRLDRVLRGLGIFFCSVKIPWLDQIVCTLSPSTYLFAKVDTRCCLILSDSLTRQRHAAKEIFVQMRPGAAHRINAITSKGFIN